MHDARDRNQGIGIEHNDRLYVAAYSSVASLSVMFSGYFRRMDGEVVEYAVTVNPTSDRAVTAVTQHFGAGFLLSCVASLASGNANRGQCYVRAQVQRSTGTPAIKLHNVIGGYLSDDYAPSFPYGKIEGPLDGPGMFRSITGTDPAAGVEISETVPTGARWKLHGIQIIIVTSADVASRTPALAYDDGTTVFTQIASNFNLAASNTYSYCWGIGLTLTTGASVFQQTNGTLATILPAGSRIRTNTGNLQAADNYGPPQLQVEEWIEA